ncbi:MAG: glycoside hydrolase family 88 protein [Bacteroides xylanisolvens]
MRMKYYIIVFAAFLILCGFSSGKENGCKEMDAVINKGLGTAIVQSKRMAESLLEQKNKLPRTIGKKGELTTVEPWAWTSGFFPGVLWYLYEVNGSDSLKTYADNYTRRLVRQQYTKSNHDVGFMLYCSYGNGWRLTKDDEYRKVLLQGAKSLSTRFRPQVGCIRSWDRKAWQYAVIIDNMMNLELLLWASKHSDESKLGSIARSHADVTMEHHFRPDYSCYHVVSYDTITGQPDVKGTYQGYADNSDWARGQGWALYGYTMMYRETKLKKYLDQAIHVAKFIMSHPNLPEDKIPYWDFDAPDIPNAPRDASAGALMASALIELSQYTKGSFSRECLSVAEIQLKTLTSSEYLAEPGTNCNFILKHSVGNKPKKKEVDVPLTYADYYYVEALIRYKRDILKEKVAIETKK